MKLFGIIQLRLSKPARSVFRYFARDAVKYSSSQRVNIRPRPLLSFALILLEGREALLKNNRKTLGLLANSLP